MRPSKPVHLEHHDPLPEGEEAPPPGVATMAVVRWALVALMAVAAVGAWLAYTGVLGPDKAQGAALYHCPMHPSVVMDYAGECGICGMDLVPIEAPSPGVASGSPPAPSGAKATSGEQTYTCPMHPNFKTHDANARCPDCGMKLVPEGVAAQASAQRVFTCPMHPDFKTHDESARCPECGMKLVEAGAADAAQPPSPASSGVPGLTPVMISSDRIQLIGMRTALVAREKLQPELRTIGYVSPNEDGLAMIHTRFSGWIEQLFVSQTGQKVKKGEVLATLYSAELLTAQQEFLNALSWSDSNVESPETKKLSSTLERDARRRLELLGISSEEIEEVKSSGKPLHAVKLRSPVSGYVTQKGALAGLFVQPGTELFTVADLSTVWVLADVYEHEVARVHEGQPAKLKLAAYPDQTFTGKVQFIYPTVSAETRTLRVRLAFKNPELRLRPGMYGDVMLELKGGEGLVIPREALVDTGQLQYVFVAQDGGRFEPRRVKVGSRTDTKVELLEGVYEGEKVVTTANFLIDSESRLRAAIEGLAAEPETDSAGHVH